MSNLDKYFKGQQTNETFICFMRHHWIYLLKEFLYFTIFLLVIFFTITNIDAIQDILRGNREMKLLFITAFFVATLYLHRFFIKLLNFFVNVGIITDMRFIDHQKSLFFTDTMDSIDMAQIQNLERLGEGVLRTILGYGDIRIFLTASAGVKTFYCLPHVQFHFRCIGRQKELRQMQLTRDFGQLDTNKIFNRDIQHPAEKENPIRAIPFEPR